MVEWIPFNRFNRQKFREDESEMIFMATWVDGRRIIKRFEEHTARQPLGALEEEYTNTEPLEEHTDTLRVVSFNLEKSNDSSMSDSFIKNFTNYIQSEGNIYGITQIAKKQFAMVIPDEFSSRRDSSNGICRHCKHYNTSPAWCQSCDPWKATQRLTSGNEEIDNFIKEFQTKATESSVHGNWSDGIRTIEGESGNYTQSRTILCVELIKSHSLQSNALGLIENNLTKATEYEKVIEWIPSNRLVNQQEIKDKSDLVFMATWLDGIQRLLVNPEVIRSHAWCQSCDPWKETQGWASNDKDIDDCIKEFQLRATAYEKVVEWIHFDRLKDQKFIGKGGFGTVYCNHRMGELSTSMPSLTPMVDVRS
ncbi:hypothetical protein C2G38_2162109 [Gigaspora rosea]|uniref:Protein kinase domain-containing protein n=1 Tax=Gigaspora rosea TaxID=44941 RepID=A0A397VY38_9GLOM|nr:hypothetical protein C2G38_2162109 [Gigaspora rosea]